MVRQSSLNASTAVLLESVASSDHPAALNDEERLAALRELDVLDAPTEHKFDLLTELANSLLETPVSLITLVTDTRQFFVSSNGLKQPWAELRETPHSHSFCQYVVRQNSPLVVSDSKKHPLVCDNLAVSELGVAAYLGVPLIHGDHVVGSFCVIDGEPRQWTNRDIEALRKIADLASSELANHKRSTQRKFEQENRLRQSQKMEAIAQLTTGFAHNFHNIMWAIQISSDLLKSKIGHMQESMHVEHIQTAVNTARDLVGQLLNWSRPGEYSARDVSLTKIVNEALPLLRTTVSSTAEILFDATDEGRVFADADHIKQLLLELCSNASHAMGADDGEISVLVATHDFDSESAEALGLRVGRHVELQVADHGCGIPDGLLDRIHDPYFTTKPADDEAAGLGLWTVFGIVRRHDGQIRVTSESGKGTTFRIFFPELHEHSSPEASTNIGQQRIVLVTKDERLCQAIQAQLPSISIDSFTDTPSALEHFLRAHSDVDLLITDRYMPILSGDDLVQRCRLLMPTLPVVVRLPADKPADSTPRDADVCCLPAGDYEHLADVVSDLLQQSA